MQWAVRIPYPNAVLIQTYWTLLDRVNHRLRHMHKAGLPIFVENCAKADATTVLFRCGDNEALLASILRDVPLCRVLTRLPFVVSHCTQNPSEVADAFREACVAAVDQGRKVKLHAPASIKSALLKAVLDSPAAQCLVTCSETALFQVAAVYRSSAWFYSWRVADAWQPDAAQAAEQSLGHWCRPTAMLKPASADLCSPSVHRSHAVLPC